MKYTILALLCLTGCSSTPKQFVCFTPFTPLSAVQVDTSQPGTKYDSENVTITTADGNVIVIPRAQCIEVRRAKAD